MAKMEKLVRWCDTLKTRFTGSQTTAAALPDAALKIYWKENNEMEPNKLSDTSRAILEAIAKGHTYEQILVQDLAWTYHDIFQAATDALELAEFSGTRKSYDERLAEIKQAHPKAYQPWTKDEDARLTERFLCAAPVEELAREFQRQPGAIRSRLAKLNLDASK